MAKKLMIQGTMSNAGKSLLTAGLLRIMKQDGYKAAPFKSQNMALNSYITKEGLEMGRAQVVQAEAAMIEPSVDMNPILLKPTTDMGSQVIVHGVSRGNMMAREYFAYKKNLVPEIMESFHRLEEEYDIIVIEGAGSPAEINLKQDDIVNMGLASLVDAPVLLVGDIDRGGVFAQLYGTVMLLEPEERNRIKGLIINKFRGDKTILDPGISMIEGLCRIPVVGVTPYLSVEIDDEDSLSSRLENHTEKSLDSGLEQQTERRTEQQTERWTEQRTAQQTECRMEQRTGKGLVDIAVIRLPRMSNFSDFTVFSCMPEVSLRYVASVRELGNPDLVILPGTKNTIDDLLWMRASGLEAAVKRMASENVPVFGICGGYQMMGMSLLDAGQVDGNRENGPVKGMELIPTDTCYEEEKVRTRVAGAFGEITGTLSGLSGKEMEGYEIHMGITKAREGRLPMTFLLEQQGGSKKAKLDGISDGNCYGTYVHGIFDGAGVAEAVVQGLLKAKGMEGQTVKTFDYHAFKEQQYDKLAEELRKHLDMKRIYEIMGIERG